MTMKPIKAVTLTYTDGTQETVVGKGTSLKVSTVSKTDDNKSVPVEYHTISIAGEVVEVDLKPGERIIDFPSPSTVTEPASELVPMATRPAATDDFPYTSFALAQPEPKEPTS